MQPKNKKFLIIYTVIVSLTAINMAIVSISSYPQMKYIPFNNFFLEWMYNLVFLSMIAVILGFSMGYILSPLLLFAHKKIIGRKYDFGLLNIQDTTNTKRKFLRGIYPVLMAMNLSVSISENLDIRSIMVVTTPVEGVSAGINTFLYFIPLILILSVAIFTAVWFLDETKIIYTNLNPEGMDGRIEVKSVSGYFGSILKGYTGLTTIIVLGRLIIEFAIYSYTTGHYGNFFFIVMYPILPFAFCFLISPIFVLLDKYRNKRTKYLLKRANKLGITKQLNVKIE